MKSIYYITFSVLTFSGLLVPAAQAQNLAQGPDRSAVPIERAEGATLSKAVGHYARSRTLLIAAIREFDRATNLVDPDSLIDAEHFRTVLLERSRDLEHILAPQPRTSKEGVRFEPDRRLLGEALR